MKRPIKFRGKNKRGKWVFGDFVHGVPMSSFPGIVDENDNIHSVDPDSIAQLVGYDSDGCEVYEGDTLILPNGTEYDATLFDNIIKSAKLKEATK